MSKDDLIELQGVVTEVLAGGNYKVKVGENHEAFPVCGLLKEPNGFRRKLFMIAEQKPQQHVRVQQIFLH